MTLNEIAQKVLEVQRKLDLHRMAEYNRNMEAAFQLRQCINALEEQIDELRNPLVWME